MFGQSTLSAPPSRLGDLMRNLRDLEARIRRVDPREATRASAEIAESVGTALEDIAERFRNGAGYAAKEAGRLGSRANALSRDSYQFLKGEVDAHPLAILAVAAGVGVLIGASLYQRSRSAPPQPRPSRHTNRRIKRRARK
jgi:ElaB/YqjD/DUF883 family membrane-anchored ribosome-binding protein